MKKILAALILAITSFAASADQWVGSEVGLSFGGVDDGGIFTANIAPEYGAKISDRCAIGAQLHIGITAVSGGGYDLVGFGPFFRYYFTRNENFNVAGDVSVMAAHLGDWGGMFRVRPVVSYRFKSNWELFGRIDFIEVGYFGELVGGIRIGRGLSLGFTKHF